MNLILSFIVCVVGTADCHKKELTFVEATPTPFTCMLYAQAELAKWDHEHPAFERKPGYKCGPAKLFAKI